MYTFTYSVLILFCRDVLKFTIFGWLAAFFAINISVNILVFFFFFFLLFWAASVAYRSSQTRGGIGAAAAGLRWPASEPRV